MRNQLLLGGDCMRSCFLFLSTLIVIYTYGVELRNNSVGTSGNAGTAAPGSVLSQVNISSSIESTREEIILLKAEVRALQQQIEALSVRREVRDLSMDEKVSQLTSLRRIFEERLASTWSGWANFSREFDGIIVSTLQDLATTSIAYVCLTQRDITEFTRSLLSDGTLSWHYDPDASKVQYIVPENIKVFMERTSSSVQRDRSQAEARCRRDLEKKVERKVGSPNYRRKVILSGSEMIIPEDGWIELYTESGGEIVETPGRTFIPPRQTNLKFSEGYMYPVSRGMRIEVDARYHVAFYPNMM